MHQTIRAIEKITLVFLGLLVSFAGCSQTPRTFVADTSYNNTTRCDLGTVKSSSTIRGDGIPVIVLGNASSSDLSSLKPEHLPFALVLAAEPGRDWASKSRWKTVARASFIKDESRTQIIGQESETTISGYGNHVAKYELHLEPGPCPMYSEEKFSINSKAFDLAKGRLFFIDKKMGVTQYDLKQIERDILPPRGLGGEFEFEGLLNWWQTIRDAYPEIAE